MSKWLSLLCFLLAGSLAVSIAAAVEEPSWPGKSANNYLKTRAKPASVWAVGDGADGSDAGTRVARRIARRELHRFLYLGDVYDTGTAREYRRHYEPVYGRFKRKTAPTIGNHEYSNRSDGYIPYWRRVHGQAPPYFTLRVSGWQLISLNSEAPHAAGSTQVEWLERMLGRTERFGTCRIAFWHRPRYSAGSHGDQEDVDPFWDELRGRAKVVLNGHDHDMQKFKPRDGMHQFVSGAGGHDPRPTDNSDPRLSFADDRHLGALRLGLRREALRWSFVSAGGRTLRSGEIACQRP